ncbi:MAG: DoxX family protein [Nitriliruptorales bacterium]|nr:DoxX family protein [Nitriliruptorales bacterium]
MDASFDLAALLLRGVLGVVMLAHGINHVWGSGGIEGTDRWFDSLGMHPSRFHAWLASITEIVSGALLVVGFLTPLAASGAVGVLTVAWITNHLDAGFFVFRRPTEGWEYILTLVVIAAAVGALGPGAWSLDALFDLADRLDGWSGFVTAIGAGWLGAGLVLAVFWRPDPDDAPERDG